MILISQGNSTGNNPTSLLSLFVSEQADMCWTCFKFTYRPCEFSQAQASASLGSSMDGQLNRIREREEQRERFLIAHNSCALIVCVSSYCVSKTDPMTKKTFYRPEGYPV